MMKRECGNVVCSSPDSTVQTEEINDDLTFFDYTDFSLEFAALVGTCEGDNNNITRVDHSTGAINVAPPNMLDIFITPDGGGDLVSLQPLQATQSTTSSVQPNGDALWPNSHPPWNGAGPKSLDGPNWPNGTHPINANGLKCKSELAGKTTSHLRELLLQGGNASAYQKKNAETLVTLLKQQPYNNKEDSNGGYDVTPMYTVSITQVPTSNGRDSISMSNQQSGYPIQKDGSPPNAMYDNVNSPVSTTVNGHVMYNVPSHMSNGNEMSNGHMLQLKRSPMLPSISNSGNYISQDYSKNNPPPNGLCSSKLSGIKHKPRTRTPTSNMKKEGSRLHPCQVCAKSFKDRFSLDAHYRIHTGERPFKCDVCNKGFKQKAHMQKHQSMHSGTSRDRVQQLQLNRGNKKEYNRERKKKDKVIKKPDSTDNNGFGSSLYPDSFSESSVSTTTGALKDHIDITHIKKEVDENTELYNRIPSIQPPLQQTSPPYDNGGVEEITFEVEVNQGQHRVEVNFMRTNKMAAYQCTLCRKSFLSHASMEEHAREHSQTACVNPIKLEDGLLENIDLAGFSFHKQLTSEEAIEYPSHSCD